MDFKSALGKLNIEDYGERIFHSNSHGELLHLADYANIVDMFDDVSWFREWFEATVKSAEEKWERPESVFQHIPRILKEHLKQYIDGE